MFSINRKKQVVHKYNNFNFCFTCSNVYKIGSILRKTESRHVEYKTGGGRYIYQILPSHVRMYGSAFLNTSGGVLCVGVNDEG